LFTPYFTDVFSKHFQKLTKKDGALKKRLEAEIEEMRTDPYRNSRELVGQFLGKRRVRIGSHRLIYAVCEECRTKEHDSVNACYGCKEKEDSSIIYFDLVNREGGYDEL
jgi:mRNA-degrading endonuclease RelE of RelBE toxin-antitoxin system